MTYVCDRCGDVKDHTEFAVHEERHPYGDTYAVETLIDTGCSCGGEYEEGIQCDRCGEYVHPDNVFGYEHALCKKCCDEMYSTEDVIEIAKKNEEETECVSINSLLAWSFTPNEIEKILWRELNDSRKNEKIIESVKAWADSDESFIADELYKMEETK